MGQRLQPRLAVHRNQIGHKAEMVEVDQEIADQRGDALLFIRGNPDRLGIEGNARIFEAVAKIVEGEGLTGDDLL